MFASQQDATDRYVLPQAQAPFAIMTRIAKPNAPLIALNAHLVQKAQAHPATQTTKTLVRHLFALQNTMSVISQPRPASKLIALTQTTALLTSVN